MRSSLWDLRSSPGLSSPLSFPPPLPALPPSRPPQHPATPRALPPPFPRSAPQAGRESKHGDLFHSNHTPLLCLWGRGGEEGEEEGGEEGGGWSE